MTIYTRFFVCICVLSFGSGVLWAYQPQERVFDKLLYLASQQAQAKQQAAPQAPKPKPVADIKSEQAVSDQRPSLTHNGERNDGRQ